LAGAGCWLAAWLVDFLLAGWLCVSVFSPDADNCWVRVVRRVQIMYRQHGNADVFLLVSKYAREELAPTVLAVLTQPVFPGCDAVGRALEGLLEVRVCANPVVIHGL
jgi:hypothetical protein